MAPAGPGAAAPAGRDKAQRDGVAFQRALDGFSRQGFGLSLKQRL
jgi:hypothetical protein